MKILMFSWRDIKHPSGGGAEIATMEHAKYWVNHGHEVIWFASYFSGAKKIEQVDGINIVRRGNQLGTVFIAGFLWYLGLKQKPDIVIDQIHGIPFFTPIFVRKPKLVYIHETARKVWFLNHLKFPFNYIYGLLGYISEPIIIWLFYRNLQFMTVSESSKNDLGKFGIKKNKISVIQNGLTKPKKIKQFKKEKQGTLIYLGALAKDKGVEDTIEVFEQVKFKNINSKLWIVGKGHPDYIKYLKSKIILKNFTKEVKFWGYVSEEKKFELLMRSHVLINPSKHEGWGLTNIEANFVGTPVVAYDVSGCRDSVKEGKSGYIVSEGVISEMAEKIIKIINSNENLANSAKDWSNQFSWEKAGKKSLQLLETMV